MCTFFTFVYNVYSICEQCLNNKQIHTVLWYLEYPAMLLFLRYYLDCVLVIKHPWLFQSAQATLIVNKKF